MPSGDREGAKAWEKPRAFAEHGDYLGVSRRGGRTPQGSPGSRDALAPSRHRREPWRPGRRARGGGWERRVPPRGRRGPRVRGGPRAECMRVRASPGRARSRPHAGPWSRLPAMIWIGFHLTSTPAAPAGPLLSDRRAGAAFARRPGSPSRRSSTVRDEERLLLAMTLGVGERASSSSPISGQARAGEGAPLERAPRRRARCSRGGRRGPSSPTSPKNRFRPDHIPAHPGESARRPRGPRIGLLHPDEAAVSAAAESRGGPAGARAMLSALSER